ncbi:unnamed protein product [Clonostachys rhizophaga]|uniref:Berberine/berberine-like domain-containing protein n=1 Tax=Clonostachys rhizophaga TaxID=160324 RepID=A0A9N9VAS6_9HYPO|nr:unnamed protein product [Clonostachys rhizophaga]
MPRLSAAAPNSYAYMNEANIGEKNWKKLCYVPNYLELLRLKRKWDPEHRLYAVTGVGSDEWGLRADGRLCKATFSFIVFIGNVAIIFRLGGFLYAWHRHANILEGGVGRGKTVLPTDELCMTNMAPATTRISLY